MKKIQNYCTDDDVRIWSKRLMVKHLMKRYDCLHEEESRQQAESILSTMPSMCNAREYLSMTENRNFSNWYEICGNAIEELLYLLQNSIAGYCYHNDEYICEYKIEVIKHLIGLCNVIDTDEHYSKNRIHIIYNYGHIGQLYFELGDWENAIKYLKISAEYAKKFDEQHSDITERISRFYEKEKLFREMKLCERMTMVMTKYYNLSEDFKATTEFKEILNIMKM